MIEQVAQAILAKMLKMDSEIAGYPVEADEFATMCAYEYARTALSAMPQRELLAEALDAFVHIGEYWNGSRTDGAMSDALDEIVATASAAADKIRAALEHQHQQKGEKL